MMNKSLRATLIAASLSLLGTASAWAQVEVSQPWVRATVAPQKATGAFVQLKAKSDSRLVEVRSSVAGVAEIHEMKMEGSTMKMRAVEGLDLPAGQLVELKPGSFHIMLMDLKKPLAAGETVDLTLVFEGRDKKRVEQEIKAEARAMGKPAAAEHAHKH